MVLNSILEYKMIIFNSILSLILFPCFSMLFVQRLSGGSISRPNSAFGHSNKKEGRLSLDCSRGTVGTNGQGFGNNSPMKSVLKNGVLYSCIDHNIHTLGPGYYNVSESLLKKSFNSRVTGGNSPRSSPGRSKVHSGNSSPLGMSPTTLSQQKDKILMKEYSLSGGSHFAVLSPKKGSLTVFTGSDTPPKNFPTHSPSSFSNAIPRSNKQQFIYQTPY